MGSSLSNTQVTTAGQITNGIITDAKLALPGHLKLKTATVTLGSANATLADFTSLDGDTDGPYWVIIDCIPTAALNYAIYVNNDTTGTNYYSQRIQLNNTTITGSRVNTAEVGYAGTSTEHTAVYLVTRSPAGVALVSSFGAVTQTVGASCIANFVTQNKTSTTTNITRITIITTNSTFASGSKATLLYSSRS